MVWGGLEVVWGGLGCLGVVLGVSTDRFIYCDLNTIHLALLMWNEGD